MKTNPLVKTELEPGDLIAVLGWRSGHPDAAVILPLHAAPIGRPLRIVHVAPPLIVVTPACGLGGPFPIETTNCVLHHVDEAYVAALSGRHLGRPDSLADAAAAAVEAYRHYEAYQFRTIESYLSLAARLRRAMDGLAAELPAFATDPLPPAQSEP